MKAVQSRVKIDFSKYVNKDTGETLLSEQPNIMSLNIKDEKLLILESKEYVIVDSQAFKYIMNNFTYAECSRILQMTDMVKGRFNILQHENMIHTKQSLMEELDYSRNIFANFVKKLIEKHIISIGSYYKKKKEIKYIMLNPFLARKSKIFDKECIAAFKDIREIKNS